MKIKFMTYNNYGGIQSVISRDVESVKYFNTYNELLVYYKKRASYVKNKNSFNLEPYGYDTRLNNWVMVLVADHSGFKAQFICYVTIVEVEE